MSVVRLSTSTPSGVCTRFGNAAAPRSASQAEGHRGIFGRVYIIDRASSVAARSSSCRGHAQTDVTWACHDQGRQKTPMSRSACAQWPSSTCRREEFWTFWGEAAPGAPGPGRGASSMSPTASGRIPSSTPRPASTSSPSGRRILASAIMISRCVRVCTVSPSESCRSHPRQISQQPASPSLRRGRRRCRPTPITAYGRLVQEPERLFAGAQVALTRRSAHPRAETTSRSSASR